VTLQVVQIRKIHQGVKLAVGVIVLHTTKPSMRRVKPFAGVWILLKFYVLVNQNFFAEGIYDSLVIRWRHPLVTFHPGQETCQIKNQSKILRISIKKHRHRSLLRR
jgi:hypothetical protein